MPHPRGQVWVSEGGSAAPQCPALNGCLVFAANSRCADAVVSGAVSQAIRADIGGDSALIWVGAPHAVETLRFDSSGIVTREFRVSFAGWNLVVPAGARVRWPEGDAQLSVEGGNGGSITFGSAPVTGQRLEMALPPSQMAGQFKFSTAIPVNTLDASIRYFYRPAQQGQPVGGFTYPLFRSPPGESPQGEALAVTVSLDPSRLADSEASYLTVSENQTVPSNLRTTVGRTLNLASIAGRSRLVQQWDPRESTTYVALDGDWMLSGPGTTGPTGSLEVMCGLSGLEYAKVPGSSVMQFVAGAPAYAPGFPASDNPPGAQSLTAQCPGSEYDVTTSWVYFSPPAPGAAGPVSLDGYYSQPQHGGLFQVNQTDLNDPFLGILQIQTAAFPPAAEPVFGAPRPSFPMAAYAGVQGGTPSGPESYRNFEVEILSTTRSNAIFEMNWPGQPQLAAASPCAGVTGPSGPTGPNAVTPQGMLATFSNDYALWKWLVLAKASGGQKLELGCLCQQLRAALLTNQMFLVISNPAAFKECCEIINFPSLRIADWGFELSPGRWRKDTVLILKFAEKSLEGLINDTSLWSAPNSGFNNGAATQTVLKAWVKEAQDNADQPEFQYFLNTVLKDWNGIIFANCSVPAGDFPPQLIGISAGIDMNEFSAHHFGVNLSPVSIRDRRIEIEESSLFALIYYNDPQDLVYSGTPYDYKVLSLRVLFANSDISSFASTIELLVGELFGERSSLQDSAHGDNIILNGVWQRNGYEDSYTFTKVGADTFILQSQVLQNVLVSQAQFVTLEPEESTSTKVKTRFILAGSMRFKKLEDEDLDIFSFGPEEGVEEMHGLQFSNLFISMEFDSSVSNPDRIFAFTAGQMVFDLSSSIPRKHSLYARFPLRVASMVQGNDSTKPSGLGYIPLVTELVSGPLGNPWFGLEMALKLGSQGGLAAKAGFNASLLAAWSPNPKAYNVAIGLRLPGSEGGKKSITIEGPLKLNIGDLALLFNAEEQAYIMRFNNIMLSFLGLQFPPGGRTNLLLFGDPDPNGTNTTLGWYAAYKKDEKSATGPPGPRPALQLTTPSESTS